MKGEYSMEAFGQLTATPFILLRIAIEKARLAMTLFAMKRYLLTVLTVVITVFVLICSLAAWPSVERMLLARMREAILESRIVKEGGQNGQQPLCKGRHGI